MNLEKTTIFLQKWRVRLGHVFGLLIIIFARPETKWLIVGAIVSLAGEAVRVVSAGSIMKDQKLSISGPYARTRNPLYFGSFLMYLGLCLAANNIWVTAAYFPFFFAVYYATIYREEKFLAEKFGAEYDAFKAAVPRFLPRLKPAKGAEAGGGFSFPLAMKNKEYEALAAVIVTLGALWAMGLTGWTIKF